MSDSDDDSYEFDDSAEFGGADAATTGSGGGGGGGSGSGSGSGSGGGAGVGAGPLEKKPSSSSLLLYGGGGDANPTQPMALAPHQLPAAENSLDLLPMLPTINPRPPLGPRDTGGAQVGLYPEALAARKPHTAPMSSMSIGGSGGGGRRRRRGLCPACAA